MDEAGKCDPGVSRATTAPRKWFLVNRCGHCNAKPFMSVDCLKRMCAIREVYGVADGMVAVVLQAAKGDGRCNCACGLHDGAAGASEERECRG